MQIVVEKSNPYVDSIPVSTDFPGCEVGPDGIRVYTTSNLREGRCYPLESPHIRQVSRGDWEVRCNLLHPISGTPLLHMEGNSKWVNTYLTVCQRSTYKECKAFMDRV